MASINGLAPEAFLVDSGAGATMLSRAFCDRARIDYPAGRFQLVPRGPEGQLKLTPIAVDRLEIGSLRIRRFAANVVELPHSR